MSFVSRASTRPSTARGVAPIARRIPNSRVRWATEWLMTPKMPVPAEQQRDQREPSEDPHEEGRSRIEREARLVAEHAGLRPRLAGRRLGRRGDRPQDAVRVRRDAREHETLRRRRFVGHEDRRRHQAGPRQRAVVDGVAADADHQRRARGVPLEA